MINLADKTPCDLLLYPNDEKYAENIRKFQGCPTVAVTLGGRIFAGWYSGGTCEPHMENYSILVKSDNGGESWSEPVLIIPSSKEKMIHALDIQLHMTPNGELHVYWMQNNVDLEENPKPEIKEGQYWFAIDGYQFLDFKHALWRSICKNPDADVLEFSEPEYLDMGFLRCKPLVLDNGRQINFNYDQLTDRYGYSISDDGGKTFARKYGAKKIITYYEEPMAYQREDGSIRVMYRNSEGFIAESISNDNGETWTDAALTDIKNPSARFYVSRTPSGKIILVHTDNSEARVGMSVWLSDDDGATWKYKKEIDSRTSLSYPDVDFYDGKIYLVYDRERTGAKEILFATFTEEDIIENNKIEIKILSKP